MDDRVSRNAHSHLYISGRDRPFASTWEVKYNKRRSIIDASKQRTRSPVEPNKDRVLPGSQRGSIPSADVPQEKGDGSKQQTSTDLYSGIVEM